MPEIIIRHCTGIFVVSIVSILKNVFTYSLFPTKMKLRIKTVHAYVHTCPHIYVYFIVIATSRTVFQHENVSLLSRGSLWHPDGITYPGGAHNVTYLSPVNVVQVESLKLSLVSYKHVLTLRQFWGCYNFSLSCENSSVLCK